MAGRWDKPGAPPPLSGQGRTLPIPSLSQVLGEAMTGISQNAKNGNLPEFGEAIATASKALCGFTEAAAQVIPLRRSPHAPLLSLPRLLNSLTLL